LWPHPSGAGTSDPYFGNVVLLMGYEGANGSTGAPGMTDESPAAHGTAVVVGSAQISTAKFKFGASSYANVAGTNGIHFPDSPNWQLSAANSDQFTVEIWANPTNASNTQSALVWQSSVPGTMAFIFWANSVGNGELTFTGTSDGSTGWTATSSGITWTPGQWYHLAADKDATGKLRVYRDGVMLGSITPANSAMFDSSQALTIGVDSSTRAWVGYLDEVRITKGVARYASDAGFAVPTAAFPRHA
jgi:hypothetical protein